MEFSPIYVVYCLVFCAGFLALQVMIGATRQASQRVRLANDRLRRMNDVDPQTLILSKMRKSRGLNNSGDLEPLFHWIGQLVLQSGLPLGQYGIYALMPAISIVMAIIGVIFKGTLVWALSAALAGLILPIFILIYIVKRRRKKAVSQLPEALDVIIRSLAAGHPLPVSMSLVASEMPDPIGSEFGMASDEISYGASVSGAIARMSDRIGHEDVELFSAMIRLQERTGGNLAELLRANAATIRDRQKMRLRIKAASAEGRMSALILNLTPFALYFAVNALSPDFFGGVKGDPLVKYTYWGLAVWMGIGNLVMRKMINFKI